VVVVTLDNAENPSEDDPLPEGNHLVVLHPEADVDLAADQGTEAEATGESPIRIRIRIVKRTTVSIKRTPIPTTAMTLHLPMRMMNPPMMMDILTSRKTRKAESRPRSRKY
jgi:hypothetical protein